MPRFLADSRRGRALKADTMKDFDTLSYICCGPCLSGRPGQMHETRETVIQLLLSRMLFSLIEFGSTPEQARAELAQRIAEIADLPEDPYREIDFEIHFQKPEPPKEGGTGGGWFDPPEKTDGEKEKTH